nr:DUF421 domain-containing protein [Melghirimyces profundicolus]
MEMIKDIPLILGRVVTILPLLLFVTLFMGRRSIGEMPVFDFLIIVVMGAVVGADIADPNIHHLPTFATILAIGLIQRLVSRLAVSRRKIGRLLTFEPAVVVWKGEFLPKTLGSIRYSVDNILVMLREQQIFDLDEVEMAVIEPNGNLSVQKRFEKQNVSKGDLNLPAPPVTDFSHPVILEGKVETDVLAFLKLDRDWLRQRLKQQGISSEKEVFFASVKPNGDLTVSLNQTGDLSPPPLKH